MPIDDRTVLVTSQLTSSPAVARLHQWPATVARSLTAALRFHRGPRRRGGRRLGRREVDAYRRSDADMLDGHACDAAILIDENQSVQMHFLRDAVRKR
ncbi:hypothetical protein [Mycobacterium neumannii]|uniref:hypothetical protein n=1 Tax=Mycobacterium neumannii TaxID=2048551 RepID=UPI000F82C630|nr:hypothetical protein [Mycobacterium neumannii]